MSQAPSLSDLLPPGATGDVVIIKPSSLGDIVHTLPAVAWLHQAWPDLRLHWVANTEWAPLLRESPLLASVIEFPRAQFRGLGGLGRLCIAGVVMDDDRLIGCLALVRECPDQCNDPNQTGPAQKQVECENAPSRGMATHTGNDRGQQVNRAQDC